MKKRFSINLSNKVFYTLVSIAFIIVLGVGVSAVWSNPTVWHDASTIKSGNHGLDEIVGDFETRIALLESGGTGGTIISDYVSTTETSSQSIVSSLSLGGWLTTPVVNIRTIEDQGTGSIKIKANTVNVEGTLEVTEDLFVSDDLSTGDKIKMNSVSTQTVGGSCTNDAGKITLDTCKTGTGTNDIITICVCTVNYGARTAVWRRIDIQ
jgi:hypothetical protein